MRLFLAILSLGLAVGQQVRYEGYKVFELTPQDQQQVELLSKLQHIRGYDFWLFPGAPNRTGIVMVSPGQVQQLEQFLQENRISGRIKTENVQESIDAEEQNRGQLGDKMTWDKYQTLQTIYDWLDSLAHEYPAVRTIAGGSTYENRTIKGIEINFGRNLPGVVMLSGLRGREWLAPASTTWAINQILQSSKQSVFRKFNFLYFPFISPDSYVYSWKKDRYWAKTRSPQKVDKVTYYGVDPDRNYNFHWKSGRHPWDDDYQGPNAFSEIETSSMSNYLKSVAKKRKNDIYLMFQTVGTAFVHPWGWTTNLPKRHKFWQNVSIPVAKAWGDVDDTDVSILTYAKEENSPVPGNTLDWTYNTFNCTFPFLYKLRGDDHVVPPKYILTAGREVLVSLKALLIQYTKVKPTTEV